MRTKLSLLLLISFILLGCSKNNNEPRNQLPEGKLINYSDCKDFYQKTTDEGNNESCVEYTFLAEEEKLILKHINTGFNCCPGELRCIVHFDNDTIKIEEFETEALCNCDCLFDMDIEITGIKADEYFVKFIEPYCGDQKKLEFLIDLHQNSSGEYCVERDQYPWGI